MSELMVINQFVQKLAQSMAYALEMDTQVIDTEIKRVGGTVRHEMPTDGGVIKKILENGETQMISRPKSGPSCPKCPKRNRCNEFAYMHCPILHNGKIVGVMGLICYNETSSDKLVNKRQLLLNFVQNMCDIISLKLTEQKVYQREQELHEKNQRHNQILNSVLNNVSDGYILLDENQRITNVNQQALQILGDTDVFHKSIVSVVPDLAQNDVLLHKLSSAYDDIYIGGKSYGAFISSINNKTGTIINFKNVKNIGQRAYSRRQRVPATTFDNIIGKSRQLNEVKELARRISGKGPNVLILGESGTGKELFARSIHSYSPRRDNPFIPVNCAAIPSELLESELFGYAGGAFTGAAKGGKLGKFEMASGGTIFLDEIGDMPIHLQAKILRVLQEEKVDKLGSVQQIAIDARIIAATNKDLELLVKQGLFREDLYYRLSVIPLTVPPLRERGEDIPMLVDFFMEKYCAKFGVPNKQLSGDTMRLMERYQWPGNTRELENVVQYLVSVSDDDGEIGSELLPQRMQEKQCAALKYDTVGSLQDLERSRIVAELQNTSDSTDGKRKAAKVLGISLTTLYRKLEVYKITPGEYRS